MCDSGAVISGHLKSNTEDMKTPEVKYRRNEDTWGQILKTWQLIINYWRPIEVKYWKPIQVNYEGNLKSIIEDHFRSIIKGHFMSIIEDNLRSIFKAI